MDPRDPAQAVGKVTGRRRRTIPLPRPTAARLLEGVLALGRDIHLDMDESELAHRFLYAIEDLFPGRIVALRLREGQTGRGLTVCSEGATLRPQVLAGPLVLKRSSVNKTKLSSSVIRSGQVRLVDVPPPIFEETERGFSVPLVANGELYGVLDVAYPPGSDLSAEDEPLLLPIANHLSVAVRNVRLHGEAALLRDYLGKLIEHADALILGVDRDWRVTVFNQALARLTGFDAPEVIGTDVRDWLPPQEKVNILSIISRALTGRAPATFDLELPTKSGETVRTAWNVAAIGRSRMVEAVVAVGQDLTQIRSLERQVIQAEKLATLGQLAAGVVHELNNPLTSIIVYADFLLKKLDRASPGGENPFEAADTDKLRRILEGAERILNFSRDLVEYARPATSHPDVVSLNDIVRQSLSFCEHLLKNADVELVCEVMELSPLYAVRGQLQQVVINLVTNAVHAMAGGHGRLHVRTYQHDRHHVGLAVEDSGPGVSEEDRERIFEPFYTTKTDGKGTGLGLSIVKNIVEGHRGTIGVEAAATQGARFVVILPTGH
jgi:PAS domain S-box-containing protein